MNKKLVAGALLASAALAQAADKDPVLMKIDGQNVKLSEFEYLYNKNNSQQAEPVSFDKYIDMFVDYKLKVADAHAAGIDTTQSFKTEFNKFRNELAMPYLRNEAAADRLARDVYARMSDEVEVSHIMLPLSDQKDGRDMAAQADSLRTRILNGEITFEAAAATYSVDKYSANRAGLMGWVPGNSPLPYEFEEVAFSTPLHEISEPVNSGFGYHLIRPERRRTALGEVKASHILLLTQGMDANQKEAVRARIDSIYNVAIQPGADFAALATQYSEDPGSASKGGDLGWFGPGRMVAQFDSASFATPVNTISKPFATTYGYHIVMPTGRRGGGEDLEPYEVVKPKIMESISKDARSRIPVTAYVDSLAEVTNSRVNPNLANQVTAFLKEIGVATIDSLTPGLLMKSQILAYTINGNETLIDEVLLRRQLRPGISAEMAGMALAQGARSTFEADMLDLGRDMLADSNSEYANLINEYRDGIMLFEISNRKVWEKASKDKEGLEAYFQANKDKYTWDSPRFKSYVIFANNDSVMNEAKQFIADHQSLDPKSTVDELKKQFGRNIKVERVIAAKGENAITDFLGFGADKPATEFNRWAYYFAFNPQMLDEPQEASDVKGLAVNDYQAQLEKEWLEELHKTHSVSINKKVLKKARENAKQ